MPLISAVVIGWTNDTPTKFVRLGYKLLYRYFQGVGCCLRGPSDHARLSVVLESKILVLVSKIYRTSSSVGSINIITLTFRQSAKYAPSCPVTPVTKALKFYPYLCILNLTIKVLMYMLVNLTYQRIT